MLFPLFLSLFPLVLSHDCTGYMSCSNCTRQGCIWCPSNGSVREGTCLKQSLFSSSVCKATSFNLFAKVIRKPSNCADFNPFPFPVDTNWMKDVLGPLVASVDNYDRNDKMESCIGKASDNFTIVNTYLTSCKQGKALPTFPSRFIQSCFSKMVADHVHKSIFLIFRGSISEVQLLAQLHSFYGIPMKEYGSDRVKIIPYYGDAFVSLWEPFHGTSDNNPGMKLDLQNTRAHHPDYDVVFTGVSLGGALASVAAYIAVLEGLVESERIKMVSYGQPRIGSKQYVDEYNEAVPYSLRVVNAEDPIPHIPAIGTTQATHHHYEMWYKYGMEFKTDEYMICEEDGDSRCSEQIGMKIGIDDHLRLYDYSLLEYKLWVHGGCK